MYWCQWPIYRFRNQWRYRISYYPKGLVLLQDVNSVCDVNTGLVILSRYGHGDWAWDYEVEAKSRMSLPHDQPSTFITEEIIEREEWLYKKRGLERKTKQKSRGSLCYCAVIYYSICSKNKVLMKPELPIKCNHFFKFLLVHLSLLIIFLGYLKF